MSNIYNVSMTKDKVSNLFVSNLDKYVFQFLFYNWDEISHTERPKYNNLWDGEYEIVDKISINVVLSSISDLNHEHKQKIIHFINEKIDENLMNLNEDVSVCRSIENDNFIIYNPLFEIHEEFPDIDLKSIFKFLVENSNLKLESFLKKETYFGESSVLMCLDMNFNLGLKDGRTILRYNKSYSFSMILKNNISIKSGEYTKIDNNIIFIMPIPIYIQMVVSRRKNINQKVILDMYIQSLCLYNQKMITILL